MGANEGKERKKSIQEKEGDNDEETYFEDNDDQSQNLINNTSSIITLNNDLLISQIKANPFEDYSMISELGSGAYSKVELVKNNITNIVRAMKIIKKRKKSTKNNELLIINEINILKKLDHPNIVKIFEFYNNPMNYYLITEYCGGGELFDIIKENGAMGETHAAYIMFQVFSAINYCHKMRVMHRDLKPENILIDREENGYYRIKICDFGTSKIVKTGEIENNIVGSVYYIAPEVLKQNYNSKCDLWSCGVIMFILLTGKPPFGGKNQKEIIFNIQNKDYKKELLKNNSKVAQDLISKLLERDVNKRLSAEKALRHKWFEINKSKEILNDIEDERIITKLIDNLKNYKCNSILQETALAYLVHNYPQLDDVVNACKLFNKIDKDGNGKISREELFEGISKIVKKKSLKEDIDKIFSNLDSDNNNYLEYEEFVRAAIDKKIFLTPNILKFAFKYFDKDGSGEITVDEISSVFKSGLKSKDVHESLKKIIKEVDINGDGIIQFDEFSQVMKNLLK